MQKRLFPILASILLFTFSYASAAPVFTVDNPVCEFGSVPEGKIVKHTFMIRNTGDKDLRILEIQTGCGCTTASHTGRIAPGEEGSIDLELDTMGFAGFDLSRPIKITTNDPANKISNVYLKGTITSFAIVEPPYIKLQGQTGDAFEAGVSLRSRPGFPFTVKSASAREGKDCSFEVIPIPEGGGYHIRAKNLRTEPGSYYDLITLEIDSPIRKTIDVRILGTVRAKGATP